MRVRSRVRDRLGSRRLDPAEDWPRAILGENSFGFEGRLATALELAPLNLELMADGEREGVISALAQLYDSIDRPFLLLSVPADRPPHEHLHQVEERLDGRAAKDWYGPYVAIYRTALREARRPIRRTFLCLEGSTEPELTRAASVARRAAHEVGVIVRDVDPPGLAELWARVAKAGETYAIGASVASGPTVLTAVALSRRWPAEVAPGWLSPLLAVDGVIAAALRVRPLSRAEAMHFLTVRLRHVRAAARLSRELGELDDVARERLGETAVIGRRTVHAGAGRIYLVDVVFLIEARDHATLGERLETLRLEARGLELDVEPAALRVGDAWRACLPGPAPAPIAERNLDSMSLAGSLLHAETDLYEPSGHFYGTARSTGAPIVLDRFAHPSHSAIVLGQTGTGKTMFTGAEIGRCVLRGIRVLGLDPLGDYRRLTASLGGTYVELGAETGINPFVLTADRTPSALAAKIANLSRLVGAMAGGLTRDEWPALDSGLRAVYERAGIGTDPGTHDRPAPRLADLAEVLTETAGGASLARRLERWATGSLGGLFTGHDRLPLDGRLLFIGFASISDPDVRAVAQLAALSVVWDAVRRDLAPKLVVVDETWKVMRQPSGAEFVEELARSARHYHAGLQLATQDIAEFLRSDFGEAIVKQCDIRVLLGQTPEGVEAIGRYFDLTQAERRLLLNAAPGEGLLFVGRSHVAFDAVVSRREYSTLTTRPADLLGQSHSRFAPPDTR